MKTGELLKNRVFKNIGWLVGGRLAVKVMSFLVGIFTARYLGPSNYGLIDYAGAYIAFFSSLCTLGINSVIVKQLVKEPSAEGEMIGTAILMRVVSSVLSALMIIGIVSIADRGEPLTIIVVALCTIGLAFQSFDTINSWFQARLQSKFSTMAALIAFLMLSAYKVIMLILGKSVEWFAVASAIEYVFLAISLLLFYYSKGGPKLSFSIKRAEKLIKDSSGFILAGLMISVYACTDRIMLKQMLDKASVGYYSLAVSISGTWVFVLSAIIDSVYPGIVKAHEQDMLLFEKRNKQLYALVFYSSVVMSALVCIVAEPLVSLIYGEQYLPAVAPLRIVVWYTAFSYLGVARNPWIVCENKQKYLKYIYAGAALTNVFLNFLLIPHYGASGAAAASLVTQIVTILIPAFIPALRPNAGLMFDAVLFKGVFDLPDSER